MLEIIWFVLWGILWSIYFMLDGFDLGVGMLHPFLAKNKDEKKVIYGALGPFWDANEVWLVIAGGVTFAAFPRAYAALFSSFYAPLLLVLFGLIIRNVAIEFRQKLQDETWQKMWDFCLFLGSLIPAFFLGIVFSNVFRGIYIDSHGIYLGTFFDFFNGYGVLGGVLFVFAFLLHGSIWLSIKSEGDLFQRTHRLSKLLWGVLLILGVTFLISTFFATNLFNNYLVYPVLFIIPLLLVVSLLLTIFNINKKHFWKAWAFSSATLFFVTAFGLTGLFPNMLPSLLDPNSSITIYNAASSVLTLKIMLGVALTTIPFISIYQIYGFRVFRHKVKSTDETY